MPRLAVARCFFALLISISILIATPAHASENDTVAVSPQDAALSPGDADRWTLVGRMVLPFTRIERDPFDDYPRTNVQLGGLAAGLIAPSRVWLEGGVSLLHGLEGLSWEATALGGYAVGYTRASETWNFSLPVYAGYRFSERPSLSPTDGRNITRPTHYVVCGTRLVATRFFSSGLFELGLDISIAVPFAEGAPSNSMWNAPASTWINGAVVLGI